MVGVGGVCVGREGGEDEERGGRRRTGRRGEGGGADLQAVLTERISKRRAKPKCTNSASSPSLSTVCHAQ